MKLAQLTDKICIENDLFEELLSLNGKKILELGCGKADITRLIATTGVGREVTATEVDQIQHSRNLQIDDLPNVNFFKAGSESIPFADESYDIVFMFKSFHHVPKNLMGTALKEVERILKPGGMVYISEPIFAGSYNEVLRLFHDEEMVRQAAFDAIKIAVNANAFLLVDQLFFNKQVEFVDFAQFERNVIGVTHSNHQLSSELLRRVKETFMLHMEPDGAKFLVPLRVDLLQKNG